MSNLFKSILIFLTLILFIIFSLKLNNSVIYASDIIFQDNFDTNLNRWYLHTYSTNNFWKIDNGEMVGSAGPDYPLLINYAKAGNNYWENYSFEVKIYGQESIDKIIFFRFNSEGRAYGIDFRGDPYNDVQLNMTQNIHDPNKGSNLIWKPYYNSPNGWYTLRVDVENVSEGVSIKVFVDNANVIDFIHQENPIFYGGIALGVWPNTRQTIRFDNVIVRQIGTSNFLNVPDIKQFNPLWGNLEYDSASSWSPNPTISRWGCALTSSAMILQYYNHFITPDNLNKWLKSQADGYLTNGLLNWLAISRYSKFTENINSPVLEYKRSEFLNSVLDDNLLASPGRPVILKLYNHFVVAKGKFGLDYFINDPSTTNGLLSQLGNQIISLNTFIPSYTDLSYILLTVESKFDLKVYNPKGSEIKGFTYTENALQDDINYESINNSIKIFQFPKPPYGKYSVLVSGKGNFHLNSYLYNSEGKLNKSTLINTVNNNISETFYLNIGENNSFIPSIYINSINELIDILNKAKVDKNISNVHIYNLLINHITHIKKNLELKNISIALNKLKTFSKELNVFTPKFINIHVSTDLITKIDSLLKSLSGTGRI